MTEEKGLTVPGTPQKLQSYLFSEDIKKKFEMAVPKWMSVDRLLRVVFASVMRNPKLLQCTTESILSAVMQCAQLGLEPILGRAHLVPYRNNKKPGKPLECQFQPGYQGLVDLAERSGKIETVKAHVVYENDEFEIEYGLNERLVHKPQWKDRGKPIGAYTVWTRKSGVKTYTFMFLEDIYSNFRAKSTAYQYAIKNKSEDTPWIENEPEMLKKSLVKRHSKLEPASIEFMTAVEIDNLADIGERPGTSLLAGLDSSMMIDGGNEDQEVLIEQFDKSVPADINKDQLKKFLESGSQVWEKSIDEIKAEACEDLEGFWTQYRTWEGNQKSEKKEEKPGESWNPYSSEIQQRYGEDKRAVLEEECKKFGIDVQGKTPRVVHELLLKAFAQEATKQENPAEDSETPSNFNDQKKGGEEYTPPPVKLKCPRGKGDINGYVTETFCKTECDVREDGSGEIICPVYRKYIENLAGGSGE